jgi:hypothetical protein
LTSEVNYHFGKVALQQIRPEKYGGWDVDTGKIAYNQIGYRPLDQKVALAPPNGPSHFQVLATRTSRVVQNLSARQVDDGKGKFSELDFSGLTDPGEYILSYGSITTKPFTIADDVWNRTIEKNFNYWYAVRCGFDVPGVHVSDHFDLTATYNGVTKVVNGGWYDAGDMFQVTTRTHDIILGMLALYERLDPRQGQLRNRVLEELYWGLKWALYIRFAPGVRCSGWSVRFWTDNIVGDDDDVTGSAAFSANESLHFAALAAKASRLLKMSDPAFAAQLLQAGEDDFAAAIASTSSWASSTRIVLGWGALASIELLRATGNTSYTTNAQTFAALLVQCQQQTFLDPSNITGYFYTSPARTSVVHDNQNSSEEAPLVALRELCAEFPDDPNWIAWYSVATIYSEFFMRKGAQMSAPFNYLPNSVWTTAEIQALEQQNASVTTLARYQQQIQDQFMGGTPTSPAGDRRLRTFPIWTQAIAAPPLPPIPFRGGTMVQLSGTLALVAAAGIRGNVNADQLARDQLSWVLGRNPFARSLMFGEGYDYQSHYAAFYTGIVGSLPIGMDATADDAPFYPDVNQFEQKEQWGWPSGKFLWSLANMATPAFVTYSTPSGATFRDAGGRQTVVRRGSGQIVLPAGEYTVTFGNQVRQLTFLSGSEHNLSLDPASTIELTATATSNGSAVNLSVQCSGAGQHTVALRLFNLQGTRGTQSVTLDRHHPNSLTWQLAISNTLMPWVVVAVADDDLGTSGECFGPQ